MSIDLGFGPSLVLKADLNIIERWVKLLHEESVLYVAKARPAFYNGKPGILKLGGGAWWKIVFLPDDKNYFGRCFLDQASEAEARREFDELCKILSS